MFLKWNDSFSAGIKWIDDQHKTFIIKMNKFLEATVNNKASTESADALKEIENYADYHFKTEEEYMHKYRYPNRDKHYAEHERYSIEFQRLKSKYALEGPTKDFIREFQLEIINWYTKHITSVDKEMADFLRKKVQK